MIAHTPIQHSLFSNTTTTGQYWGEMGFFRIAMGQNLLGIEGEIAWATPGTYTTQNFPCSEDGKNCNSGHGKAEYLDPSRDIEAVKRRLKVKGGKKTTITKTMRG